MSESQYSSKQLTDEEILELAHRQWKERQAEYYMLVRYSQAKQRMEATYGRLLTKSFRLILLRLMEVADFLWRRSKSCENLLKMRRLKGENLR